MGVNPETYSQRFRAERYPQGARPRAMAQKVKELAWRWLGPEKRESAQITNIVALEQFLQILPPGAQQWVRRHCPQGLTDAVALMENYRAAETPRGPGRGDREGGTDRPPKGRGCPERGISSSGEGTWGLGRGVARSRPEIGKEGLPANTGGGVHRPEAAGTGTGEATIPRPRCYECGQEGHFKRKCPFMDFSFWQGVSLGVPPCRDPRARVTTQIWVEGVPRQALVDSGCGLTMVCPELVPSLVLFVFPHQDEHIFSIVCWIKRQNQLLTPMSAPDSWWRAFPSLKRMSRL